MRSPYGFLTSFVRLPLLSLVCGTLFVCAGCKPEESIQEKTEPVPTWETPYPEKVEQNKISILGGIVPYGGGGRWLFFKLMGPTAEVENQRERFDAFIASVTYKPRKAKPLEDEDEEREPLPFTWQAPDSWQRTRSSSTFRIATYRMLPFDIAVMIDPFLVTFGDLGPALFLTYQAALNAHYPEMSVSQATGTPLANINRWRGQIGLEPIESADLPRLLSYRHVDGATIMLVSLTGPGTTKETKPAMPPFHPPVR